jgi:hypothetical protein
MLHVKTAICRRKTSRKPSEELPTQDAGVPVYFYGATEYKRWRESYAGER